MVSIHFEMSGIDFNTSLVFKQILIIIILFSIWWWDKFIAFILKWIRFLEFYSKILLETLEDKSEVDDILVKY